jgi:hypothetical protein
MSRRVSLEYAIGTIAKDELTPSIHLIAPCQAVYCGKTCTRAMLRQNIRFSREERRIDYELR